MVEDNTPTVTARRRKATRHMRLRLETVKKIRAMGAKRKSKKDQAEEGKVTVKPSTTLDNTPKASQPGVVKTRAPKIKKATLTEPPVAKAKFRKRQVHKSWLPTHMYHTKRARMTSPKEPLWRFAIPMTPTAKSYRPTHRAASERGALCWDVSYMSTISLNGREESIAGMLKQLGAGELDNSVWTAKGKKWRDGKRVMEFFLHEREIPHSPIAPVTIIWCAPKLLEREDPPKRQVMLRVHPSAFLQLWEEVLRVAKIAKPAVMVEDLRFEMGSIDVTGPASTEALLSALWPALPSGQSEHLQGSAEHTFTQLNGLTNPALLPSGAVLAFDIQDPRLHHPPRPVKPPTAPDAQMKLLQLIAAWPPDSRNDPAQIFDRKARVAASASLPSQKAINRRRTLATPGEYPEPVAKDPRIPVMLYVLPPKPHARNQQLTYRLLLPWKCAQPVWYSLMYTPLSTGQQPKFGGLDEQRQIALERGEHWFPADYPGTKAGWIWEVEESKKRKADWDKRPKAKRTSWEAVDLGNGKKGEIGDGWACDWRFLLDKTKTPEKAAPSDKPVEQSTPPTTTIPTGLTQLQPSSLLRTPPNSATTLLPVRINLITRGLPTPCARIYRLPTTSPALRAAWLALHPSNQPTTASQRKKAAPPASTSAQNSKNLPPHVRQQRLAASLLEPPQVGSENYPACPGEEDLIGFVTAGNYDLGAGKGMGVGCVVLRMVEGGLESGDLEEGRLCVVRSSGLGVARLGRWEV
jgi:ribonuclease P/MRP protein subunit POP1